MNATLTEARKYFENDRYATINTGCIIDKIEDNNVICSMEITKNHKNAANQVMGGAIFTLADFTFAVAANFHKPNITVSVASQIVYLGTVKGTKLIAKSHLIKDGTRNCFYEINVFDNLENKIASVTITGTHLNKQL